MNRKQFLEVLFDYDHKVAWGDTNARTYYANSPWPDFLHTKAIKFCINPLVHRRNTKDIMGNNNCYALLFECDDLTITPKEQAKRLLQTGIPFSTMTYSGGKSIHMIIRFEEPMQDEWTQKSWWKTIAKALETHGIIADNKARLITQISRIPGSINTNTGKVQKLIQVRERVSFKALEEWLAKWDHKWYKVEEPKADLDWTGNDHISSLERFKLAIKWNTKSQGTYSQWLQTGGHVWLVKFGILCYSLDIPLEATQKLSVLEWGESYKGHNGGGDVATAIKKGWNWGLKNRVNKKQLK